MKVFVISEKMHAFPFSNHKRFYYALFVQVRLLSTRCDALHAIARHVGSVASWPGPASVTVQFVVECGVAHLREFGPPGPAQFANDTIFQGTHVHPEAVGWVGRLCPSPVFVPPRAPGVQAAMGRSHGSWQAKGCSRFEPGDLSGLQERSLRHVAALRRRRAVRIESAQSRRAFPGRRYLDLQGRLRGRIVSLRSTDANGAVAVLGRRHEEDRQGVHRLVRAEVGWDGGLIRIARLRLRDPGDQPMMREVVQRIQQKRSCA